MVTDIHFINICYHAFLFLHRFYITLYGESIMCVTCSSLDDAVPGDCQLRPPNPTRCVDSSGVLKYCVIAREFNANGSLERFDRSCSTDDHGESCQDTSHIDGAPAEVCYSTCDYDGCNGAESRRAHPVLMAAVLILHCIAAAFTARP